MDGVNRLNIATAKLHGNHNRNDKELLNEILNINKLLQDKVGLSNKYMKILKKYTFHYVI